MNLKLVTKYMGYIMLVEGVFMLPAALVGLIYGEIPTVQAFAGTAALIMAIGFLLGRLRTDESISMNEGFVICALGWVVMSLFGAGLVRRAGMRRIMIWGAGSRPSPASPPPGPAF